MSALQLRPAADCRYDILSLGEVMLRLDPGEGRIRTARSFGVRGAVGCSDRGNTASAQLKPGDIDWEHIFGTLGVRWFHTGDIFAALSETTGPVAIEAAEAARRHGTIVSHDLNYRPSLWKGFGGLDKCREINGALARHVDVMIGNEEDFTACLGGPARPGDYGPGRGRRQLGFRLHL